MNILITGGMGFIGHNVVRVLEDLHHEVRIIDNRTDYGIIPRIELDYLMNERTTKIHSKDIVLADISETLDDKLFDGIDVVIHLASFPRQKVVNKNPTAGSRVMSEGLLNLLELSVKHGIKRFVYASSSMIYGNFDHTNIKEDTSCEPIGQYGIMKLAGEWLVRDYTRQHGLAHTIVRPSAVYGPCDVEDRVISKFFAAAMRGDKLLVNGPEEVLDFTYVDNTAMGIALAAISDASKNDTYNISKGQARTLLEAASLVVKIVGKGSVTINHRDMSYPVRGQLSIEKAKKDFGYNPEIDLEQGLVKYYEWLKQVKL
jgi:nucleoside-diphosphate-sugar epimerase